MCVCGKCRKEEIMKELEPGCYVLITYYDKQRVYGADFLHLSAIVDPFFAGNTLYVWDNKTNLYCYPLEQIKTVEKIF